MQILPNIDGQNKSPSFTSTRLYRVKVEKLMRDGRYKKTHAYFSELSRTSDKDIEAMEIIRGTWGKTARYIEDICKSFFDKNSKDKIFCIELKGKSPLEKRILSLSDISTDLDFWKNSYVYSNYIQAKDPFVSGNILREYKGMGTLNAYGNIRYAKESEAKYFVFDSTNYGFHIKAKLLHMGISSPDTTCKFLYPREMEDFMQKVEGKYNFKRDKKIK